MFRAALVLTLRRLMPQASLVEVGTQSELMRALGENPHASMVLLDLRIPEARGLSALILIRGEYPDIPVAIVSGIAFADTIQSAPVHWARLHSFRSPPVPKLSRLHLQASSQEILGSHLPQTHLRWVLLEVPLTPLALSNSASSAIWSRAYSINRSQTNSVSQKELFGRTLVGYSRSSTSTRGPRQCCW